MAYLRWGTERFPIGPLESLLGGLADIPLAERLACPRRNLYRWRKNGINALRADELAVHLGHHPGEIWPEWWESTGRESTERTVEVGGRVTEDL